jgi:hypothetical protein
MLVPYFGRGAWRRKVMGFGKEIGPTNWQLSHLLRKRGTLDCCLIGQALGRLNPSWPEQPFPGEPAKHSKIVLGHNVRHPETDFRSHTADRVLPGVGLIASRRNKRERQPCEEQKQRNCHRHPSRSLEHANFTQYFKD